MELAWHSPADPDDTEVARYSCYVLPWIAQRAAVVNLEDFSETLDSPQWRRNFPRPPLGKHAATPGESPLHVYNFGNNPLHTAVYQQYVDEPGVVVLHDLCLIDLARYISRIRDDEDWWRDEIYRQYGESGREMARLADTSPVQYAELVSKYPLFLPFIERAVAVVVHSSHAENLLRRFLPPQIQVKRMQLPFPMPATRPERDYGAPELRFVFCGHVGPNRRLEEFIRAWGMSSHPERFRLEVYGKLGNSTRLLDAAETAGLGDRVDLRGFVAEEELDEALASAHFALNLRWPTLGETSASQLRYWAAALPTLVTDVGWYGELPEDVVLKVSPDSEIEGLCGILDSIASDPHRFEAVGTAGWEYLRSHHNPEHYAGELVEFLSRQFSRRLVGRALDGDFVDRVAALCNEPTEASLFEQPVAAAVSMLDPDKH